jgi:hypothetical protein
VTCNLQATNVDELRILQIDGCAYAEAAEDLSLGAARGVILTKNLGRMG